MVPSSQRAKVMRKGKESKKESRKVAGSISGFFLVGKAVESRKARAKEKAASRRESPKERTKEVERKANPKERTQVRIGAGFAMVGGIGETNALTRVT